jgi:hypothetical protein
MSNYRLLEAIVDYFSSDASILAAIPEHSPGDGKYHIAAWAAGVPDRRPFLGVQLGKTLPITNSNAGWKKTSVLISAYSSDEIICLNIADTVENLVTNEEIYNNRDISNSYITVANAIFRQRWGTGKTPDNFDDGTDVYVDMQELEVIWLARPCSGNPYGLEYEVCPEKEDDREGC